MSQQETELVPTTAQDWLKTAQPKGMPLRVPSGNVCLVRPVGIQVFMQRGAIPNALMPLITRAMDQAKGTNAEDEFDEEKAAADLVADLTGDPRRLEDVLELTDLVVVETVIEPQVHPVPKWTEEDLEKGACAATEVGQPIPLPLRPDNLLWVDVVDLQDRLFIFNFAVGGTRDLEQFRGQSAAVVDGVPARKNVGNKTKRPARPRKR